MTRMPEPSRNLPIPTQEDTTAGEGRVLPWPQKQPESRVASPILNAVTTYIESQGGGQGLFPTAIDGFNIVRSYQAMMPMRALYRPSLCVVLQGAKEIRFGDDRLDYRAMECLVVSIGLPAAGRIVEASPEYPYVGVLIDFDVVTMRQVLEQLDTPPAPATTLGPCAFVGKVDQPLADCILRLVRMTETPKAIPILAPSVMREICYWLLSGPHGGGTLQTGIARIEHRAGRQGNRDAACQLCADIACRAAGRCGAYEPVVVSSALQSVDLDDTSAVPETTPAPGGKAPHGGRGRQCGRCCLQSGIRKSFTIQPGILT